MGQIILKSVLENKDIDTSSGLYKSLYLTSNAFDRRTIKADFS